jgi:hypothetical protein
MSRSKQHRHAPSRERNSAAWKNAHEAYDRARDDRDFDRATWRDTDTEDEPRFECVIDESAGLAERHGS